MKTLVFVDISICLEPSHSHTALPLQLPVYGKRDPAYSAPRSVTLHRAICHSLTSHATEISRGQCQQCLAEGDERK